MEISVTVTHTLAPEVLTILQGFLNKSISAPAEATVKSRKEKAVKETASENGNGILEQKELPVQTAETTVAGDVAIEAIRKAVQVRKDTRRDAIKELLTSFGVPNVSSLPKERYSEFLTKVEAL